MQKILKIPTNKINNSLGSINRNYSSSKLPRENLSFSRSFSTNSLKKENQLRLILVGAPGCGKGTQSTKLQRDFGLKAISTGHLLRNEVLKKSELGSKIEELISKGSLVPDPIVLQLMKETLENDNNQGWVLDGFPRTKNQAEQLKNMLEKMKQPVSAVFYLDVSEDAIWERVKDRWVHQPSGRDYNTVYKPPKVAGKDDVTGEALVKRADDNLETVRSRLRSYKEATMPLIQIFKDDGLLHVIDSPTSDVGYVHILKLLEDVHHLKPKLSKPSSL